MSHLLHKKPCLFAFEAEEFGDLRLLPLAMRYRLDCCGWKLSLAAWQGHSLADRQALLELPFTTPEDQNAWLKRLRESIRAYGLAVLTPLEKWEDPQFPPDSVKSVCSEHDFQFDSHTWHRLPPLERYVLCKLAVSKTGGRHFLSALREFAII